MGTSFGNQDTSEIRRSSIWRGNGVFGAEIGQDSVANFIASEAIRDPDIRIALEGPWGCGKTRILSLVQRELVESDNNDVVVAWYDPWKYSPDETVLRRTLLDAIGRAIDVQCPECQGKVTRDRFHGEVERVEPRPAEKRQEEIKKANKAFWAILKGRSVFYLTFGAIWTTVFLVATWLQNLFLILGNSPSIFVAAAGAALLAALVQDAVQAIQVVEVSPNIRTTLPKLDQIDQFEAEYCSVMTCLAKQKRNLVVLVDDLDRCNEREIQTVMSGLTTYLEAPHEETAGRVAFVVAMDENKIVQALRSKEDPGIGRQNVVQKHFHLVVPVPIPTASTLLKVLESTLEELKWDVPVSARRRMAHLIAVHAGSNLRILRSATTEAHTIARYYADVLEPQGIKVAQDLVEDPILRFRVALIREISPSVAVRTFLSDARIWLGKSNWPQEVPKELFDAEPSFTRNRLDPRPLLGLAPGMMLAAVAPATQDTIEALKANKQQEVDQLLEGHQPEALINLVSLIIAAGLPDKPPEQVGPLISGLVCILQRASESLDHQDLGTFNLLKMHLQNNVQPNQLSNPKYREWVEVAAHIGENALKELFQAKVPIVQANHLQPMFNELMKATENGNVNGRLAYQLHVGLLGEEKWETLMPVAVRLVKAGKLGACQEIHLLQVQCMEKWNYVQKPEGPPMDLYTEKLVKGIEKGFKDRAATAYQIAANQQQEKAREFVAALPQTWPAVTRRSLDSEEELT